MTSTKAVVELERLQALGDGFRLLVKLAEIHMPRMWVEQHPTLQHSQVAAPTTNSLERGQMVAISTCRGTKRYRCRSCKASKHQLDMARF